LFWSWTLTSVASLVCGSTSVSTPWTSIWRRNHTSNTTFHHKWRHDLVKYLLQVPPSPWIKSSVDCRDTTHAAFSCQDPVLRLSWQPVCSHQAHQPSSCKLTDWSVATFSPIRFVTGAPRLSSSFTSSLLSLETFVPLRNVTLAHSRFTINCF
jgi:hypothetical protein